MRGLKKPAHVLELFAAVELAMNSLWHVHDCGVKIKGKGDLLAAVIEFLIFLVLLCLFSLSQEEETTIKTAVEVDRILLA